MVDSAGEQSWLKRNWIWGVPLGCLGCLGVPIALAGLLYLGITTTLKQSGAYEIGVERARSSEELRQLLGSPIDPGWLLSGSVNLSGGSSGTASLSIPISGSDGEGTLYIEATKYVGKWELDRAEVEIDGSHDRVDLLDED